MINRPFSALIPSLEPADRDLQPGRVDGRESTGTFGVGIETFAPASASPQE